MQTGKGPVSPQLMYKFVQLNLTVQLQDGITDDCMKQLEMHAVQVSLEENELNIYFKNSLDKILQIIYGGVKVSNIKIIENSLQQALKVE